MGEQKEVAPTEGSVWDYLSAKYDKDGDDAISPSEYGRGKELFERLDVDRDGKITAEDSSPSGRGGRRGFDPRRGRGADRPRKERGSRKNPKGEAARSVGSMAPDFELEPPSGGHPVRLSSFRGDRPVALIFGSYT